VFEGSPALDSSPFGAAGHHFTSGFWGLGFLGASLLLNCCGGLGGGGFRTGVGRWVLGRVLGLRVGSVLFSVWGARLGGGVFEVK